jgi:hypothetical protein
VRRPLVELLPVAHVTPIGESDRDLARVMAADWWASVDPACA